MSADDIYRLTHTQLTHDGVNLFVDVPLRANTIDDFLTCDSDTKPYRRAEIAICAKFRIVAGGKYFGGTWPDEHELSLDVLEIKKEDSAKPNRQPNSWRNAK